MSTQKALGHLCHNLCPYKGTKQMGIGVQKQNTKAVPGVCLAKNNLLMVHSMGQVRRFISAATGAKGSHLSTTHSNQPGNPVVSFQAVLLMQRKGLLHPLELKTSVSWTRTKRQGMKGRHLTVQ